MECHDDLYALLKAEYNTNVIEIPKEQLCLCGKSLREIKEQNVYYYTQDQYLACDNCGCILQDARVSNEAEWNLYEDDNKTDSGKIRCNTVKKDVFGHHILQTSMKMTRSCNYSDFKNISKIQMYMYSKESSVLKKESGIKDLFRDNILSQFHETIINETIHNYLHLKQTFRGEKRISIISAILYYVCKKHKLNKTTAEIAALFGISNNLVTTSMIELIDVYNLKITESTPLEFLDHFVDRLGIPLSVVEIIKKICTSILDLNLLNTSKPQTIISATILYLYYRKKISIKEDLLESLSYISIHTIKQYTKNIIANEQKLLNYLKSTSTAAGSAAGVTT